MVMTQDAMPVEWATVMMNLANTYSSPLRDTGTKNTEQAITAYKQALTVFRPNLLPEYCRKTAWSLANIYSNQQNWSEATTIYQQALQAAESLYQSATLLDSKTSVLAETADLPRQAAYAFARNGNIAQAVEVLEQGRARNLSESLDRDRADLIQLQQAQPDLYTQYIVVTKKLQKLENQQRERAVSNKRHSITPEVLRENAMTLRHKLNRLIQDIRQVFSYENFLALPTFEDVRQAVRNK